MIRTIRCFPMASGYGIRQASDDFVISCRHTRDNAAAHAKYLASRCAKLPFLSLLGKGPGHVDIDLRGWGLPLAT